jgi:hypothetical protein
MRAILLCLSLALLPSPILAEGDLGLAAPPTVADSGLLGHILPRFSLKTGVRVVADPEGAMTLAETPPGVPVFRDSRVIYHLRSGTDPRAERFRDWLLSDIGKRTVESFTPEGETLFFADLEVAAVVEELAFEGDAARGADLALQHCGRCHVIGDINRNKGIGSTPSFAVLRAMRDWDTRFQQFYVLRPHAAFTQIVDITEPFSPERPPPIHPVTMTLDDVEAVLAFVAALGPADLGAPLQLQ